VLEAPFDRGGDSCWKVHQYEVGEVPNTVEQLLHAYHTSRCTKDEPSQRGAIGHRFNLLPEEEQPAPPRGPPLDSVAAHPNARPMHLNRHECQRDANNEDYHDKRRCIPIRGGGGQ